MICFELQKEFVYQECSHSSVSYCKLINLLQIPLPKQRFTEPHENPSLAPNSLRRFIPYDHATAGVRAASSTVHHLQRRRRPRLRRSEQRMVLLGVARSPKPDVLPLRVRQQKQLQSPNKPRVVRQPRAFDVL